MTKDEFVSMINSELESLKKEYESAKKKVDYFRTVTVNSILESRDYEVANYELTMVREKMRVLNRLISLPAYARIQAMSDIEIEEYKKERAEELELKIKELHAKEEQEKEKAAQLKAEQEQLITKFGDLSGDERDKAIARGRQLISDINEHDINNKYGIFARIRAEIDDLKQEQEQIKSKTSEEIKKELSSKIEESQSLEKVTNDLSTNTIDSFTELRASVASDPEKGIQMANLLAKYTDLTTEQKKITEKLDLPWDLPYKLRLSLPGETSLYLNRNNPDDIMKEVQEYEETFKQVKKVFEEQFTVQKLSKLFVERRKNENSPKVDMEFLQQHTDKIGAGQLENLQSLIEQRDKLERKIFKTFDTEMKIVRLTERIKEEQSRIYKEISGWYQSQGEDILDIQFFHTFYWSEEDLQRSLERNKEIISKAERAISEVKEVIQKAKEKMETKSQRYETEIAETVQQIRALGGEKHKETEIPKEIQRVLVPYSYDDNISLIAKDQGQLYERDIANRVQQEAQNQADIREAELKGITVEQLLERREQTNSMVDEATNEMTEEDSHVTQI